MRGHDAETEAAAVLNLGVLKICHEKGCPPVHTQPNLHRHRNDARRESSRSALFATAQEVPSFPLPDRAIQFEVYFVYLLGFAASYQVEVLRHDLVLSRLSLRSCCARSGSPRFSFDFEGECRH